MRTLLVDNHDSYTYNVFHLLAAASGEEPVVVNNDAVSWRVLSRSDFDAIVLSPGPGRPERWHDFGVCRDILRYSEIPVLGICLGHQGIGNLLEGGVSTRADGDARPPQPRPPRRQRPLRRASRRTSPWSATTRWRSPARSGPEGHETAWSDDGVVMGIEHTQPADVGRPVPPRVDRHRARPARSPRTSTRWPSRREAQRRRADSARRPAPASRRSRRSTGLESADGRETGPSTAGAGAADADVRGRGADRAALRTALRRGRGLLLARQRRRADLARPSAPTWGPAPGRQLPARLRRRGRRDGGRAATASRRSRTARSSTCSTASWRERAIEPPPALGARAARRLRRLPRLRAARPTAARPTCTAPTFPTRR